MSTIDRPARASAHPPCARALARHLGLLLVPLVLLACTAAPAPTSQPAAKL
jgi:hypothetical protein